MATVPQPAKRCRQSSPQLQEPMDDTLMSETNINILKRKSHETKDDDPSTSEIDIQAANTANTNVDNSTCEYSFQIEGIDSDADSPVNSNNSSTLQNVQGEAKLRCKEPKQLTNKLCTITNAKQHQLTLNDFWQSKPKDTTDEKPSTAQTIKNESSFAKRRNSSESTSFDSNEGDDCHFGIPVRDLPNDWNSALNAPKQSILKSSPDHAVLFSIETVDKDQKRPPLPFPQQLNPDEIRWDNDHVRMPYSPQNKYLVKEKAVMERWSSIVDSLNRHTWTSSRDIEHAIMTYNKYKWDFAGLHQYCDMMAAEEQEQFFGHVLPSVAKLALKLPSLCTQPIPILTTQRAAKITMSQEQAACLLANAFFCTFPARNTAASGHSSSLSLPSINFNTLFRRAGGPYKSSKHAKLDCLLNYFRRVTSKMPCGTVTYHRQMLTDEDEPDWAHSACKLMDLAVTSVGTIEDCADGMLHVDFANKCIGGGVLGEGCVQEEIRFAICPEMILSRLFTEELAENECLVINGAERFSDYTGYGRTFQWHSDYQDRAPRDSWGRLANHIVAIDAKIFSSLPPQLTERNLRRELNKAYCGFCGEKSAEKSAVATGNWGCGAFGGDLQLKALLQLMAAAQAQRPVYYFTFGDHRLCLSVYKVYEAARKKQLTVGQLWSCIVQGGKSSSEIYNRIIAAQLPDITDTVPESPGYAANTP